MSSKINWEEVIDKEARGIDDYDLGEVVELQDNVVVTQKGTLRLEEFINSSHTGNYNLSKII